MGNLHRQTIETVTALLGSGTLVGKTNDMESTRSAALHFSITVTRDAADTDVDLIVEHSHDASTWRGVEVTNLAVTAGTPTQELDKTYTTTRRYLRGRLVNNTANDLSETEFITVRKEQV